MNDVAATDFFPYFDERMINRQRLLWAVAVRRQLERWEPFVAADARPPRFQLEGADIWQAQIEHHFTLVATRNLLRALDLPPASAVPIDTTLRDELIEGRDLHEHWDENLPIFNVRPRVDEPNHYTGKRFAKRNPHDSPYDWLDWNPLTGARLLPNVRAAALHELLDQVEAEVLGKDDSLRQYLPPRAQSPWEQVNSEWWPRVSAAVRG